MRAREAGALSDLTLLDRPWGELEHTRWHSGTGERRCDDATTRHPDNRNDPRSCSGRHLGARRPDTYAQNDFQWSSDPRRVSAERTSAKICRVSARLVAVDAPP